MAPLEDNGEDQPELVKPNQIKLINLEASSGVVTGKIHGHYL